MNFATETANANGTVDIDVTTNGFNDILSLQFSAGWDSLVMKFNSVVFTNPALPDLSTGNISGPEGAGVDEGQFSFSYGNPTGDGNVNDGEVLFTVRFDIVGDECDETIIELTGDPAMIEAVDADFNELTVSSQDGEVMINGTDCGGGGGDELSVTAATVDADAGTNVCITLTVENFIGVQAGSGTILWDPSVISYTGLANINLGGLGGSLNITNVDNGELKFVWSNPDPGNPLSIPDGDVIFEICFDVIGNVGDMSPITLSTEGNLGFEWTDDFDEVIPQVDPVDGKVTVTEVVGDPFTLTVSDITVSEGDMNVCVDITVENFNNILSTQYVITWDASLLSNPTPSNFNLSELNANSFNIDGNCATLSWSGINGVSLANGTQIYSMCFDVIGDCVNTSPVDLVAKGNTDIEIVDGNTDIIDNVSINAGSITIGCTLPCTIISIDKTCFGAQGGNVTVDVPTENCTYSWANSLGVEVSTNKNLLGVAAGTYILTVTCDGTEACTLTAVVDNFSDLVIDEDIMNAGCGDLGAIDVSVGFGSGNYSYNWNPSQDNSPNISGLEPGPYQLTVTDTDSGCTKTAEYEISNDVEDLTIASSVIVNESCLQNDGSISLTMSGGCQPYEYEWSDASIGNTPNATNLADGTYLVTVTDDATPTNSVTSSFVVDGTDPITLDGTPIIVPSTGSDGSITIQVTGGDPDYTYSWSGPTTGLPNSNMVTGLMFGLYTVIVTDSEGCQVIFDSIEVIEIVVGEEPEIAGVMAENNANGFSLSCNGDSSGTIVGSIIGGNFPMTIALTGDESRSMEVNAFGTFTIDDLAAGTYTVTVSNTDGSVSVENIEISEPDALVSDIEQGCDNEGQCDGFIDLNISGGFGTYTYNWGVPDLSGGSLDNLCEDFYTVLITDENGCKRMDTINIESCGGSMVDPDCYQVRDVITPNGDGMNDQFAVTCISDFPSSLEIYDRWGKLVFDQGSYDGTWMGISNSNEELIEGGYMYIININFGQGRREIMKGTLTLLRD